MSSIETKCPQCGSVLEIESDWIGMELECPFCKKSFTIPQTSPVMPVLTPVNNNPASGTFTFICPSCNGKTELPESLRGMDYECQFCFDTHKAVSADLQVLQTPPVPPAPPVQQPAPEEKKFIFICPECESIAELPESMTGTMYECPSCCESSPAQPATERKCPLCGEVVKIKAIICKHCKSQIPPLVPAAGSCENKKTPQNNFMGGGAANPSGQPLPGLQPVAGQRGIAPGMPQLQPVAGMGMGMGMNENFNSFPNNMIGPETVRNKSWTALVLWNLLWPGLGQIYLGHKNKGIICAVLMIPILALACVFAFVPGLGFIGRIILMMTYAFIAGESSCTMMLLQMGRSVEKDKWLSRPGKEINVFMTPEMKKIQIKFISVLVVALLLGLNGIGIIGWIAMIISWNTNR